MTNLWKTVLYGLLSLKHNEVLNTESVIKIKTDLLIGKTKVNDHTDWFQIGSLLKFLSRFHYLPSSFSWCPTVVSRYNGLNQGARVQHAWGRRWQGWPPSGLESNRCKRSYSVLELLPNSRLWCYRNWKGQLQRFSLWHHEPLAGWLKSLASWISPGWPQLFTALLKIRQEKESSLLYLPSDPPWGDQDVYARLDIGVFPLILKGS